ncbi:MULTISPECIES: bile acid:sodium symporter family protein [unclassified Marinobacter]|uniref:bile acid:sodium symporter family protein n=1 Tax=unclassified Marinobacter TaxID=83889 RepID=UPI0026E1EF18|nr:MULTISPECIES: bile acid:sodium symporter family protein [unclassified Marinobacter]MDO6441795.1 bile acid:sodium symporter family protein [Marinobacter sp. 2_MG-2023]MDO6824820.1 bile acid:sodium symporter family protein [Marinobacter sp. 1_MG-2023]
MQSSMTVQFDPASLIILNLILALMMFGVSMTLKPADFRRVLTIPRAPLAGLFAQFLLLPLATCLFTWFFRVDPDLALGMILVASCPGGSFSNIMTWLGKGNVAVSVSMSAVSSLAATVMTPFNFALYGWLNPHTRAYLQEITLEPGNILLLVLLVLALPLLLGMITGGRFPQLAVRSEKPLRFISLMIFMVFVAIAFLNNMELFLERFHSFFWLVVGHNLLALGLGYAMARLMKLSVPDQRAVTMEVGIQNSGLGLVILFTFFPDAGGMMLITAFWGVWHLVSGLTLSQIWARRPLPHATEQYS